MSEPIVTLRPLTPTNLAAITSCFEDSETRRYLGGPDWPAAMLDRAERAIGETFRCAVQTAAHHSSSGAQPGLTAEQQTDQRGPEAAVGAEPRLAGCGQLIHPSRFLTATADQAALLAAAERFMQHRLTGRALGQATNRPGGAPRTKRAAMNGVENGKLDLSQWIATAHPASVRSDRRSSDSRHDPRFSRRSGRGRAIGLRRGPLPAPRHRRLLAAGRLAQPAQTGLAARAPSGPAGTPRTRSPHAPDARPRTPGRGTCDRAT